MEVEAIVEVAAIVEVGVDAPGEALFTEIGFPRLSISIIKISIPPRLSISIIKISIPRVRILFNISCSLWIV